MTRISVENAWVEFPIKFGRHRDAGASPTGGSIDASRGVVTALQDISIDLREGDRLGLMGHNGAGKSTLLRMLCGSYPPTRGRVVSVGRISTLFNTTPGLSADGTGRENLMICGLYLGLSRRQIRQKADEIIDFADLGAFIDLPVRVYSAGMKTRLGFSIATAVEPEILLLDEGLGTGDASFTQKAQKKIQGLIERSSILVVASHSEALLARLCTRCVRLEHGRIVASGTANELFSSYVKSTVATAQTNDPKDMEAAYRLATQMASEGSKPPPELEELGLIHALTIAPENTAMLQRLAQLLRQQGKPVPAETEVLMLVTILDQQPGREDIRDQLKRVLAARQGELPDELRRRASISAEASPLRREAAS